MQNQYNLLRRHDEPELMAMCGDMGVGLVPYSPNGKGRLARPAGEQSDRSSTDKVVQAFDSPYDEPVINAVQKLAEARGVSMAQIALAWVLRNPLVSAPIVGATKPHHLPEAVDALGLELTDDEVAGARSALPAVRAVLVLTGRAATRPAPRASWPRLDQSPPSYLNEMPSRTRYSSTLPSLIVTSKRVASATRRSRIERAAVSTAFAAAFPTTPSSCRSLP